MGLACLKNARGRREGHARLKEGRPEEREPKEEKENIFTDQGLTFHGFLSIVSQITEITKGKNKCDD